jgi:hypothetical protein
MMVKKARELTLMRVKKWFRRPNRFWCIACAVLAAVVVACLLPLWLVCAIVGVAIGYVVCTFLKCQ